MSAFFENNSVSVREIVLFVLAFLFYPIVVAWKYIRNDSTVSPIHYAFAFFGGVITLILECLCVSMSEPGNQAGYALMFAGTYLLIGLFGEIIVWKAEGARLF